MPKVVDGIIYSDDMKTVEGVEDGSIAIAVIAVGVTAISWMAFSGCTSLTSVVIPGSVKEIGWSAFSDCSSLVSVTISDGVTEIGKNAFKGCKSLASVVIPDSVTEIGRCAFRGCAIDSLEHPCLTIKGGIVIEEGTLLYCANAKASKITIPEGVTTIGKEAFKGCKSLASVTIPESVTKIGWAAFAGCSSLASVTIPGSVMKIGIEAFHGCKSLASVEYGGTVGQWQVQLCGFEIGVPETAEVQCSDGIATPIGKDIAEFSIPEGVTEIGGGAFAGCKSLASVTIPESVTEIGWAAFYGCSSLSAVTIPSSVTEIGDSAFEGCTSLTEIRFSGTKKQWNAVYKGKDWNEDVPAEDVLARKED